MGVSKNRGGPPKSSIIIEFSIINHPFWGTTIFGNTRIPPGVFLCSAQTWTNCVIFRLTVKVEAIDGLSSTSSGLQWSFGSQRGRIFATWNRNESNEWTNKICFTEMIDRYMIYGVEWFLITFFWPNLIWLYCPQEKKHLREHHSIFPGKFKHLSPRLVEIQMDEMMKAHHQGAASLCLVVAHPSLPGNGENPHFKPRCIQNSFSLGIGEV